MGKIDLSIIGKKFNRLLVVEYVKLDKNNRAIFKCQCDCGNIKNIIGSLVKSGKTKSCGCLHKEKVTTHGMYKTSTYQVWVDMKDRCYNYNNCSYNDYGGRGIFVCDSWLNSFENFYNDMGDKPKGRSLNRVNNDGWYSPDNCKWSTPKEQNRNMRSNIWITYDNETKCLSDWADFFNINRSTFKRKFNKGWSIEKIIKTSPIRINEVKSFVNTTNNIRN